MIYWHYINFKWWFIDNKKYFKIAAISRSTSARKRFFVFSEKKYLSCWYPEKKLQTQKETQTIKIKIINYFEENNLKDHFHL